MQLEDRIEDKILPEPNTGCWLWTGYLTRGYGRIRVGKQTKLAHRYLYEMIRGDIPSGLELDHLCRTTSCVNPHHLEAVTHAENIKRGEACKHWAERQLSKTHCPSGHEYSAENTKIYIDSKGRKGRYCRKCSNIRSRQKREASIAARGWRTNRDKTHCKRGHEFTEANTRFTYHSKGSGVGRACRECARQRNVRRRETDAS